MPINKKVTAFSLTSAQILDGATAFTAATAAPADARHIYGVDQGSLQPSTGEYKVEGDDVVLDTFSWLEDAKVNVRGGYINFDLIATLTGAAVSSSGTGNAVVFQVDLWREDSFNVAPKPMVLRCLSRDSEGNVRRLDIGLYKVQFMPITFDGPAYKQGLKVNYAGTALMSSLDEVGAAFGDSKRRVGKLISAAAL